MDPTDGKKDVQPPIPHREQARNGGRSRKRKPEDEKVAAAAAGSVPGLVRADSLGGRASGPVYSSPVQVLRGKDAFYVGAILPEATADIGRQILADAMQNPDLNLIPPAESHITVLPAPADGERSVSPETNVAEVMEDDLSGAVTFTQVAISPRTGAVLLLASDPSKNTGYGDFSRDCSAKLGIPENTRTPHAVFGRLSEDDMEDLRSNPSKYGFREEVLPGGGNSYYVKDIDAGKQPVVSLQTSKEVPAEQKILGQAFRPEIVGDPELARSFAERQVKIKRLQTEILSGHSSPEEVWETFDPEVKEKGPMEYSPKELECAVAGMTLSPEVTGGIERVERVPLPFQKMDETGALWQEFKKETMAIFEAHDVHDATVHVLGSAGSGFSGNPKKPFKPWRETSDLDCAIFSKTLSLGCMQRRVPPNTKIIQGESYTVYKNKITEEARAAGATAVHDTKLGQALEAHQQRWSERLFKAKFDERGEPFIGDEVDFKINIGTNQFFDTIKFS